ncbi:MAG TPA: aminotransferase class I/II-fold pyridoxal phosphate-dependent enzyme [Anaerolineae bacterium]|nr:aminotransferase class I/II-fold pyridoxal phosphate-dependent enzyme [Anaerolineae bacterium]
MRRVQGWLKADSYFRRSRAVTTDNDTHDPVPAWLRAADTRYADKGLGTKCLHAGERYEKPDFWTATTPVYNATTFFYDATQELDDVIQNKQPGYVYARYGTPTHTTLERLLATLEGAEVAFTCASGMAATHLALLTARTSHDGLILCSSDVYGGVYTLVDSLFPHLGMRTAFADFLNLEALEQIITREQPEVVYFEVLTNPLTRVVDAPAVIEIAHRYGAKVVIDNTFTTPYLLRPFELGADFVTHSVTKFLAGHGDVLAGAVLCHRTDFERLFEIAIQVGSTLGANEAWLALRGLKTFPLRMERQSANAFEVARFLELHPRVERVRYPGLPSHPQHETARRLFGEEAFGAILSFDIAGCDRDRAFRFMDALQLILPATSLGDVYSLLVYPAHSTHRWYNEEQLAAAGISQGTFRLSVGIEDVDDLITDLDRALAQIGDGR